MTASARGGLPADDYDDSPLRWDAVRGYLALRRFRPRTSGPDNQEGARIDHRAVTSRCDSVPSRRQR